MYWINVPVDSNSTKMISSYFHKNTILLILIQKCPESFSYLSLNKTCRLWEISGGVGDIITA